MNYNNTEEEDRMIVIYGLVAAFIVGVLIPLAIWKLVDICIWILNL